MTDEPCKHCGSTTDECLWYEEHDSDAPCGAEAVEVDDEEDDEGGN